MAVPKGRTSPSNTRSRRANRKAERPDPVPVAVDGRRHLVPRRLVKACARPPEALSGDPLPHSRRPGSADDVIARCREEGLSASLDDMTTEYFLQSEIADRRRAMLADAARSRLVALARAARAATRRPQPPAPIAPQLARNRRGAVQT